MNASQEFVELYSLLSSFNLSIWKQLFIGNSNESLTQNRVIGEPTTQFPSGRKNESNILRAKSLFANNDD